MPPNDVTFFPEYTTFISPIWLSSLIGFTVLILGWFLGFVNLYCIIRVEPNVWILDGDEKSTTKPLCTEST